MRDADAWLDRLSGVVRERDVVRAALAARDAAARLDPSLRTRGGLEAADRDAAGAELDRTYLVRLVSEFEGALRSYWQFGMNRATKQNLKTLIDRIAADRSAAAPLPAVHRVRTYRNALVHRDGPPPAVPLPLPVARRVLNKFLARLPRRW